MEKEKKRSKNYTDVERDLLLDIVEQYVDVVENKKTNAVFNKAKISCWENKIAKEYNSIQTSGMRTGSQLRSLYEQIKRNAKFNKSNDKVEKYKTGGGTFVPKSTTLDDKVLRIIGKNYFTISNSFDSNSQQTPSTSKLLPNSKITEREVHYNIATLPIDLGYVDNDESFPEIYVEENENNKSDDCYSTGFETIQETVNNDISENTSSKLTRKIEHVQKLNKAQTPKKIKLARSNINDLRNAFYEKKIEVLEVMKEVELENLKSKQIDNELKLIIKERETLELKIKKAELEKKNLI